MAHQTEQKNNRLFDEFPKPTYEQWREQIEKSLKGASFEEKLITKTYEGISLQPLYRQEDIEQLPHLSALPGSAPYVRGTEALGYQTKPWDVCQELAYTSAKEFNAAAKHDLARGQTMLHVALDKATLAGTDPDRAQPDDVGLGGLSLSSMADVSQAFEDIDLSEIPVLAQTGAVGLPLLSMLFAHMRNQKQEVKKLRGCIGMDPLGVLAREGTLPVSLKTAYDTMAHVTSWVKERIPSLQTILVQGHPYHDGGGNAVQELAFAIATGVEYLRELDARGVSIDDAAMRMRFSFSIGSNFFMEIAKLRAARLLWAKVVHAFGGSEEAQKMIIHARTSAWTKTVYDPYVNMLRSTAEAFAGIVGGVNSLHVSPFDEAIRPADEFSRRIARNTQLILEQEAHLSKVADPAGGSWYIESLTDSLAKKSWELFQEVERKGGMAKALEERFPQEKVAEIAFERAININRRKDKFVGTNVYPNLQESVLQPETDKQVQLRQEVIAQAAAHRTAIDPDRRKQALDAFERAFATPDSERLFDCAVEAAQAGATIGEMLEVMRQSDPVTPSVSVIRIHRGTEAFEELRKNSEQYKERTGSRPGVFLANIGPVAQYKPRVDFVTGFFETGGFEVEQNQGFSSVDEAAQAAIASNASIVVICSTDDTYCESVPTLAHAIKQSNPETTVLVAGNPPTDEATLYWQAGVDDFIHLKTNCYEMLLHLQKQKGMGQ